MHVSNWLWPAQLGFANVLVIGRCVIAVDLLNNDDLFVTSNWWGQSWGRTSEINETWYMPHPPHLFTLHPDPDSSRAETSGVHHTPPW